VKNICNEFHENLTYGLVTDSGWWSDRHGFHEMFWSTGIKVLMKVV